MVGPSDETVIVMGNDDVTVKPGESVAMML